MNDSVEIEIGNNFELANFASISETLAETMLSFSERVNEILQSLVEIVKPALKAIQQILQVFFESINHIDFSKIAYQFYFTSFATLDSSEVKAMKNQLPEKIIEESDTELPLPYSVIYNSDNVLSNPARNSSESDCSENSVSNVDNNIKQKIRSFLNLEFMVQTAFIALINVLIPGDLSLLAISLLLALFISVFGKESN